jgi:putative membrane protein
MNTTDYLSGLPNFLAYFSLSVVLMMAFAFIYSKLTPHHEWQLIRENNQAASIAFGGSLIGFTLPLHSAISHSVNLLDCALWAGIAFVIQIITFIAVRRFIPNISERIHNNESASAIFVATASICVGLLNAASMSY